MSSPILEVRNVSVRFGSLIAVNDVSFTLERGQTLGLVGESGSGKSTLSRAILQIHPPTSGSVKFEGTEIAGLSRARLRPYQKRIQMIFQDPRSSLDPRMQVREVVGEPLDIFGIGNRAERRAVVDRLLAQVGLDPEVGKRFPHEFSGGQAQRIAIARALAMSPELIVADEPVSALDVSIQAQIINLLVRLRRELSLSMLFIAHDLAVVRHIADRVAVMYLGRIVEIGDRDAIFDRPAHPYTRALLSAVPIPDPETERNRETVILTGDLPSPSNVPSGCAFRTRCPLYRELGGPESCARDVPVLRAVGTSQEAACHFSGDAGLVAKSAVAAQSASAAPV